MCAISDGVEQEPLLADKILPQKECLSKRSCTISLSKASVDRESSLVDKTSGVRETLIERTLIERTLIERTPIERTPIERKCPRK